MTVGVCESKGAGSLAVEEEIEVQPIGNVLRSQVREHTDAYVAKATELFGYAFAPVPVRFDLSGSSAGMFRAEGAGGVIRYNPWIFAKYFEDNLSGTVPHEVAHYVVHVLYGLHRVKPHGPQWRAVMAAFGADPEVTFRLDLSGIPRRRQRTHPYRCACRVHEVSTTRHNRVLRGAGRYHCRYCDTELVYAPADP